MQIKENKRAISPLIASIVLIGLVLAIGGIIFLWFQSMTEEAVTKFDGQNVELVCDDVNFQASHDQGQISIVNRGNVPIFSMEVKLEGSAGQIEKENTSSLSGTWDEQTGLNQGGAESLIVNYNEYESAELIPVLMGKTEDGERKTQACEERHGETVVL